MKQFHSIEHQIQIAGGRPSGFDYLRIALAVSVIAIHVGMVSYGSEQINILFAGPLRPAAFFVLPSFFALSGFLVAGSLFRNSIPGFLALRVLRIAPALFCEVLISALIIGPAVTSGALSDYFTNAKFYSYFLNIVGDIHYRLPGVFLNNPLSGIVNVQLWTIPFELLCYVAITILAILGIAARPRILAIFVVTLIISLSAYTAYRHQFPPVTNRPTGKTLMLAFLFGIVLYACRERIPYSRILFACSAILSWVLLNRSETQFLAVVPAAYVTIWLGLQNPRKFLIIRGADYSYGVYLYGFPIQQLVAYALPQYRFWYVAFPLSLILSAFAAYLSWNLVEAPVLSKRTWVLALVEGIARRLLHMVRGEASRTEF